MRNNIDLYCTEMINDIFMKIMLDEFKEFLHNRVGTLLTTTEKDNLREDIIKKELNCIFIRYKPYSKDFNIFSIINKIYKILREDKGL